MARPTPITPTIHLITQDVPQAALRSRLRIATIAVFALAALVGLRAPAAFADGPVVTPVAIPGPYPVACSDVRQDFTRLRPGETPEVYWEGQPRDDASPRFLTDLLASPGAGWVHSVPIPDQRELFGRFRGGSFVNAMVVCYPTRPDNAHADYALPDGRAVPRMQRADEPPLFADAAAPWPVLLFSHGLGGSPLGSGYLDFIVLIASHGYVVAAPFHGDPRFAQVKLENMEEVLAAIFSFDKFIAMQAVRPHGVVAGLDLLFAHPQWRDHLDANRIGGFGTSLGGQTMMLLGGAALTTTIGQSSTRVLLLPRLKAAVGYIPYFGQPILPAFGRDQRGVDGVVLPFLAMGGTADVVAPLGQIENAMLRLGSTRQIVELSGAEHGLDVGNVPDILTWLITFLDGQVRGDTAARARFAGMQQVAGGGDDATTLDYTAPAPAAGGEQIVVEYRNASLDHFFLTAEPAEMAMLDAGVVVPGWKRTGYEFKAWSPGAGKGLPTCRFVGTANIGPTSHFYSNDANECAIVKANPLWTGEGNAFAAETPQLGLCAADRMAVTRLYNNGMRGQANHRYLTSRSEAAAMVDQGWVVEGPVFCTPP
jgi:dienelactone hydrolase